MFLVNASVCLLLSCDELLAEVKSPLRAFEDKMGLNNSVRTHLEKSVFCFRMQGEFSTCMFPFHRKEQKLCLVILWKKTTIEVMYLGFRCGKFFCCCFER